MRFLYAREWLSAERPGVLLDLLLKPSTKGDVRITTLERLRRSPTTASSRTMVAALARLEELRQLGVGALDLGNISPSRIRTLATYAPPGKSLHPCATTGYEPSRNAPVLCACARSDRP